MFSRDKLALWYSFHQNKETALRVEFFKIYVEIINLKKRLWIYVLCMHFELSSAFVLQDQN